VSKTPPSAPITAAAEPTSLPASGAANEPAHVRYLRSIGVPDTVIQQSPADVTEIRRASTTGPVFVGAVSPDMEYVRLTQTDSVGVRDHLSRGFRVVTDVRLEGVTPTTNDLYVARSRALGAALNQKEAAARERLRARPRNPTESGTSYLPGVPTTEPP